MPDKAEVIRKSPVRAGSDRSWAVLFYIDIAANPILDADNNQIVPQKASELSPEAAALLTQAERDAIDAGDAMFEQRSIAQTPGESNAAFSSRVQAAFNEPTVGYKDALVGRTRETFENTGTDVAL